jgi:hypothetical protein
MSVPHTGKLTAAIAGQDYEFNGDTWSGPNSAMLSLLDGATAQIPKQHIDIRELAELALRRANLTGKIVSWQGDTWDESLEPGDVD